MCSGGILIILCSCNGERYIAAQIESILGQTEPGIRLLISDDCSSDHTAEIAARYAERFPARVSLVRRSASSGGAARHFMTVLKDAEKLRADDGSGADYVMFADQDDVWHPDKAEKTLRVMRRAEKRRGADTALLVHCDMRITDAAGRVKADSYVRYQQMSPSRRQLNQLLVQNNVTGGAMMMNRALVELLRRHPVPERAVMHDHWIALTAAAFGEIVFLDEPLYDYRQHGGNVLGAAKGGGLREIADRLGLFRTDGKTKADMDRRSASVYTALFRQAAEFGRQYGAELSSPQKKTLRRFLFLPKKTRIGKIIGILRYGFTFNRLHRTAGECLFL